MGYEQINAGWLGIAMAGIISVIFVVFMLIALMFVLKGMALWRAARFGSKGRFVALLIVNTFGILEIIYLYVITKKDSTPNAVSSSNNANPGSPN